MPDWLVITADRVRAGRGVQGWTLGWFLRTYFGRRRVAVVSPNQFRRSLRRKPSRARLSADTVLVGLPTSLDAEELAALPAATRCRRLAAFDYRDQQTLAWTAEQEAALRSVTDLYLKPWYEPSWNYGLRMGLLPIRRYGRLTATIAAERLLRRRRPPPQYDVMFLGRPNRTRMFIDGKTKKVDQRVEWIRQLRRESPDLKFHGGLVDVLPRERRWLELKFGETADLFHDQPTVGFLDYWRAMRRARVVLAPGGNVPWSYRHYEALYAGAVVVTIDYRQRDMLVPLPCDGMVHVPDGESVVPAVREALDRSRREPELGARNITRLERYWRYGDYAQNRQALIDRFTAQFT
jgi:hypothetical protein